MSFKTRIEKVEVCQYCLSVGQTVSDCTCGYNDFEPIELEFEVCDCCGNLLQDGNPADTEFNRIQLDKIQNEVPKGDKEEMSEEAIRRALQKGRYERGTLYVLLNREDQREGYWLRPGIWEGRAEYQHVTFTDTGFECLIRTITLNGLKNEEA